MRKALLACLLALPSIGLPAAGAQPARTNPEPHGQPPIPIAFEQNLGQTDPRVEFLVRRGNSTIFLSGNDTIVSSANGEISMGLLGANAGGKCHGVGRLSWSVNSFVGSRLRWRSGVPVFAGVVRREVYPGIDYKTYGDEKGVEYDFVLRAGADPELIRIALGGVSSVEISEDGDLVARSESTLLRHRRPVAYQQDGAVRRSVEAKFVLTGPHCVGFELGEYDRSRELVIDPVLEYSTYLGGTDDDGVSGITLDASGNAYITGGTSSIDFPATPGSTQPSLNASADGFVAKLSQQGNALAFCTYLGGGLDDGIARAAVDAAGNVFVVGGTSSTNFPTTAGAFRTTYQGGDFDGFVVKLNPQGSALIYSTYLGGGALDGVAGIAVNGSGEAFVTGATSSTNFPTTSGAFDTNGGNFLGIPDAFVSRLNAAGSGLVYSTYAGGSFNVDAGVGIAIDSSGNAYVAGATNGGFPTTTGAFDRTHNGDFDGFILKLNPTGTALVFSTYLGGGGEEYCFGLAVDGSGHAYVTGYTNSTNLPVANAIQPQNAGGFDAYVTELASTGASLVYSTYLGGTGNEGLSTAGGTELQLAGAIAVDASGSACVTGFTDSVDFPTVAPFQPSLAGGFDAWVAQIAPNGTALSQASYLGGSLEERGTAIAAGSDGAIYVGGFTFSQDFPTTPGSLQPTSAGQSEGFVAKIGVGGPMDTIGVYAASSSIFFLRNSNTPGPADLQFGYGPGGLGWLALTGDWDGDGDDTAGLYDPSSGIFYLRNSNNGGIANLQFGYGPGGLGWVPLAGDWDGDGDDTVGLYDPASGVFYLRNSNSGGPANLQFGYGPGGLGWTPLVGDFDGVGADTIGLYDPTSGIFYLRNTNDSGPANLQFPYGPGGLGWRPLIGDWDGNGADTVGLQDPNGVLYLRNANSAGPAVSQFAYGPPGAAPVAGHWTN